jgi:hypothetical protein
MKEYRIEIVRRACGRFGWIFVRIDERGRRVIARSDRSYKSRKRVRNAIAALRDADVFDATEDYAPISLPATRFALVPGVVPLIVDESPLEDHDAVYKVSRGKGRKYEEGEEEAEERAETAVVEEVDVVVEEEVVHAERPKARRKTT